LGKTAAGAPEVAIYDSVLTYFHFTDFFTNLLPNVLNALVNKGANEPYFQPNIYCGIIAAIALPIFFINKNTGKNKKLGYGIILLALIISMWLVPIDMVWHGFAQPGGFPFRYSWMFSFVMLVMAADVIERMESVKGRELAVGFGFIIAIVIYAQLEIWRMIDTSQTVMPAVLFAILYSLIILICYSDNGKEPAKRAFAVLITLLVISETTASALTVLTQFTKPTAYISREDYVNNSTAAKQAVEYFNENDGSLYRADYPCEILSRNTNMAAGIYGISHTSSSFNENVLSFLKKLGFSRDYFVLYNGNTLITDSVLGIKYNIAKKDIQDVSGYYYVPDSYVLMPDFTAEGFNLYQNPYALPIAFMADNAILDLKLEKGDPFENQNKLLSALISSEYYEYFKPLYAQAETVNLDVKESGFDKHYTIQNADKVGYILYTAEAVADELVYSYIRSDNHYDLIISFEGIPDFYKQPMKVNYIYSHGRLKQGEQLLVGATRQRIETITLKSPPDIKGMFITDAYFYYLDEPAFKEATDKLKQSPLEITYFKEHHLKGTVTAAQDGILFTSMTYEPGWTVLVDGVKTDYVPLADALIGIPLNAGTHEIELKFFPRGMKIGIILSVLGVIAVVFIARREVFKVIDD